MISVGFTVHMHNISCGDDLFKTEDTSHILPCREGYTEGGGAFSLKRMSYILDDHIITHIPCGTINAV